MTSKSSSKLRLHVEDQAAEGGGQRSEVGVLTTRACTLASAFQQATGWELRFEQTPAGCDEVWSTTIESSEQESSTRLVLAAPLGEPAAPPSATNVAAVRPLALALASLLRENSQLRHAVRQREAELAAGVPVAVRHDEEPHLAERLEAVLKGGAEAIGCQAAGLYLLDDATSALKLRSAWGLPQERLLAPARPLRGSVADLEALVGHAVVLEDTTILPHWRCPENYAAAVCVPVASPTIPLGTLWVFCDQQREFTPEETNLLEIIAGRLAADLEREMLLATGTRASERNKQIDVAARWMSERLPSIAPLLDDCEVAGWTQQAEEVGGDFHDWSVLTDGRLSLTVGDADGGLLDAALSAAALQAAVKAHAAQAHAAGELLTRVNESVAATSPGDQRASLAYALVDPETGNVELSLAGSAAAIVVGPDDRVVTATDSPQIGAAADTAFADDTMTLRKGEVLLLVSSGVRQAIDAAGLRIGEAAMASLVAKHLRDSARGLLIRLRRLLEHDRQAALDMTILVVKRRA